MGYADAGNINELSGGAIASEPEYTDLGLNPEQMLAVSHIDGPLLILAGAGSGKTRVLVHRIAHLISVAGAEPWSILGVTFTNKAASEMKTRIAELIPNFASSVWISTFHAACVRILRRDIDRLGYTRSFTILDSDDQIALVKEAIKELNYSDKQFVPKNVLWQIGRSKDELVEPEDYLSVNGTNYISDKIFEIYKLYQQKLKKNNALDFDDIILVTIRLFVEFPDILQYYQNRFRYVMVDEFQDTNTAQFRLISLICGQWRNICVVGDDDQSIYGWRGANIGNILDFENTYPGTRVIKLEQNYRSTKTILEAANNVIHRNKGRKSKALWTQNESGQPIGYVRESEEHDEASYIAGTIKFLRQNMNLKWNDFAVLYRINAQSRALENTLLREGIPYRVVGGNRFFDRKEIRDIIAYLRLIYNQDDDISFRRIINLPRRGIGAVTIEKLEVIAAVAGTGQDIAGAEQDGAGVRTDGIVGDIDFSAQSQVPYTARGTSLFDAIEVVENEPRLYPELKAALPKLSVFRRLIAELSELAKSASLDDLMDSVIKKSGIAAMYLSDPSEESRTRYENILEFKSEIMEFENGYEEDDLFFEPVDDFVTVDNRIGLGEFLTHVTLISDIDNLEEEVDRVSLMTVHSAKGLEFDTVFIAGAEEGIFPSSRALNEMSQMEEERRLFYVGMTRAKKRLFLSCAATRTLFGNTTYNRVSRFVSEIPRNLLSDGLAYSAASYSAASFGTALHGKSQEYGVRNERKAKPVNSSVMHVKQLLSPGIAATSNPGKNTSQDGYDSGQVYAVGEEVGHKKYGKGTVLKRHKDKGDIIVEIGFENAGVKRFIESMVKLRKNSRDGEGNI